MQLTDCIKEAGSGKGAAHRRVIDAPITYRPDAIGCHCDEAVTLFAVCDSCDWTASRDGSAHVQQNLLGCAVHVHAAVRQTGGQCRPVCRQVQNVNGAT